VISLHKKGSRKDPNNYRSIFLLDCVGKVFCRVLANRLQVLVAERLDRLQFGFRPGRSTQQAILALRNKIQLSIESASPLTITFIDLKKAFDSISRQKMWRALKYFNVPEDEQRVIRFLHTTPLGRIKEGGSFSVERGVRQGCVLGPTLFIMVFHMIINESLDMTDLNRIAFADDLALITNSESEANELLSRLDKAVREAGMQVSTAKTKVMSWNTGRRPVVMDGEVIEAVTSFDYLGSTITLENTPDRAVQKNCLRARAIITKIRPALVSNSLNVETKQRLLDVFAKPALLYGLETVVSRQKDLKKLEAVMNRGKRMSLKINSRKTLTNEELGKRVRTRDIASEISIRRLNLFRLYTGLKDTQLDRLLEKKKTYAKDWQRQMLQEVVSHQLDKDWMNKKICYTDKIERLPIAGERDRKVACWNSNCDRMFATEKEMARHWRNDHKEAEKGITKAASEAHQCPMPDCSKEYKTSGWLTGTSEAVTLRWMKT